MLQSWLCKQVAVLTGAPLPHQMTVHIQDSTDATSDDGPPTPGDDDDDDDDKDKVKHLDYFVRKDNFKEKCFPDEYIFSKI